MLRSVSMKAVTLILGLMVALAACGQNARVLRLATYPPDFRYISDAEIESVMWRLAGRVHQLERLVATAEPDLPAISNVLERIEHEAGQLEADGASSNHPYLDSRLQEFLGHVRHARMGLRRDPPEITTADEVWRACSGCHDRS